METEKSCCRLPCASFTFSLFLCWPLPPYLCFCLSRFVRNEILLINDSAYWTNIFQVSTFVGQFFAEIAGDINMDDSIKLIDRYSIQFKLLELEAQEFGIRIEILGKKFFSLTFVIYCAWKLKWMILGGFFSSFLFLLSVTEHCDSHKIASKS